MVGDMHCHTKFSDGSTSVQDVIKIAKQSGLDTIAITDHDTFEGAFRAAAYGKTAGLTVVPGAEISSFDYKRGRKVHILCYLPDHPEKLGEILQQNMQVRYATGQKVIEEVTRLFPISSDLILRCGEGSTFICKQHVMHALMLAGYTEKIFGELFFRLFEGKDRLVHTDPERYADVFTVVNALHSAGALTVLAHPSVYDSMELLEELIPLGIDGIEINHPRNTPEDIEKMKELAKENDLLSLGGSDFHGMYTMYPTPLGTCTTDDENLKALIKRKTKGK